MVSIQQDYITCTVCKSKKLLANRLQSIYRQAQIYTFEKAHKYCILEFLAWVQND
jgi:hypothetical protein